MLMRVFQYVLPGLLIALVLTAPAAQAWWFGKDKVDDEAAQQVQTYQPPPVDALERYCEPIRQEAAELAQKPAMIRPLFYIQRQLLIRSHARCKKDLMTQQHEYLKHVDIQQPPSLPRLKVDTDPPPGASEDDAQP